LLNKHGSHFFPMNGVNYRCRSSTWRGSPVE
jgi:hypothetical protein